LGLLINRTQKWAFIHIPKTGGTTITSLLQTIPGTQLVNSHGTINELTDVDDYFIFSFVRNPYTRFASWYEHYKKQNSYNKPFSDFINSINHLDFVFFSQEYFLYHGATDTKKVSFVGKFENYENDLKFIFEKINVNFEKVPHLNPNKYYEKHPSLNTFNLYKNYYKKEWMKDWIKTKYKNDFKIFGYELEI